MEFHAFNAAYLRDLYDRYREDSDSVEPTVRTFFERHPLPFDPDGLGPPFELRQVIGAVQLSQAIRQYGHLAARLDPLGSTPPGDPALDPETHGVYPDRLRQLPSSVIGGAVSERTTNAWEAIRELRSVYSKTRGYDYEHLHDPDERKWLRDMAESCRFCPPQDPIDEMALLKRLTEVEVFEQFVHRTFPGKFRFSIEGLDMLIPMLDEVIAEAAEDGLRNITIGMAHRGRLNVLAHVLRKPYSQILAEFKDPLLTRKFQDELGWTGDVTYHMGARRSLESSGPPVDVAITMPPNPSHVEAVDPIVEGMTRAAGTRVDEPGRPSFAHGKTLPILVHGDAAFPGQGVVAETLNLSRLEGYETGGTIHIIANNQLGYTTTPRDAYSTHYASDLAKGFEMPVVHVNADDPEACVEVARLAYAYLARYHKDFVIDLIGYRRYGHNESDEPRFTQPLMYQTIEDHSTVRAQWAETLGERGAIDEDNAESLVRERMDELQRAFDSLEPEKDVSRPRPPKPPAGAAGSVETAVSLDTLRALNGELLELPEGFRPHRKLERVRKKRRSVLDDADEKTIDWPTAEELAFATILSDGIAIRMTGEDVERGTFSQRHAVFHDAESSEEHVPLQSFSHATAAFEIHNSPLTENAALGFELGYNIQEPGRLVVWEAQYGDFINGAQTMVDEFLVSARAKWGQTPSIVLLLPHGHEGHGPDHSSARLERFLQLAAETNLRIVNCTTAAQYFHLLRMQASLLDEDPLPLVVMSPKGLLRHPQAMSSPRELAESRFRRVIDDPRIAGGEYEREDVRRLVLCSGKVYVDLVSSYLRDEHPEVAIGRVEQLYVFPEKELTSLVKSYPELEQITWVQEEPQNMGAWTFVRSRLEALAGEIPCHYVGRPPSSSPAEGSHAWHVSNQEALVHDAFGADDRNGENRRKG